MPCPYDIPPLRRCVLAVLSCCVQFSVMLKRPLTRSLLVYLFYFIVAIVVTWPLLRDLSSVLAGFVYGDAHEMAHHIWWFKYAIQHGEPLFYQTLLAYPNGIEGITLWADPLQFFPAWLLAFVLPLTAAANLTILLTLALNGWAMWFLSSQLLAVGDWRKDKDGFEPPGRQDLAISHQPSAVSRKDSVLSTQHSSLSTPTQSSVLSPQSFLPSLLAGLVFMLFPTMQGHLGAGHAGLLVQWPVPLYVSMLFRLRERGGWRNLVLAALFFVLSATGHSLQLIYVLMPVTVVFALALLARRQWAALRRVVIAAVIGGLALGIFLIPVIRSTLETPAYADEGGSVRYSADLLAVVSPSFFHPLFDELEYNRQVLGTNIDEGAAYVGLVAAALALIALVKVRDSRWWLLLALVAWVLSLGPILKILDQPLSFTVDNYQSFVTLPWAVVVDLPFFNLARTPARFNFTLALAVAALAGYGAFYLWNWVGARHALPLRVIRYGLLAVMMGLIAFEYQTFFPLPTIPAAIPDAVRALSEREDVRAVFGIPWDNLVAAKDDLYLQTAHQHPLIAGQVSRRTPVNPALLTILEDTLDPALLDQAGADIVILHKAQDGGLLRQRAVEQLGEPFYEDEEYALFETPETAAAPEQVVLPSDLSVVQRQTDSFVYSPEAGWLTLTANVAADGRDLVLLRDNVPIHRWTIDGEQAITVPVPVEANTYHTVSLIVDPLCPIYVGEGQVCRSVTLMSFELETFTARQSNTVPSPTYPVLLYAPAQPLIESPSLSLQDAYVPDTASPGERLPVWLYWQFSTPRLETDIRFVHVLDAEGALVAQEDVPLGNLPAGSAWAEQVDLSLPLDLPPGEYTVYAGWYTYPEIVNYCSPQDSACGAREILLGTVQVRE